LDYRFDGGCFSEDEERRIPLEYAAGLWEQVLRSERTVPAGTAIALRKNFTTEKMTTVTFDETVEAFVVFIYAPDFADEVDKAGRPAPFVRSCGDKDERFEGPAARRVNSGKPIPLDYCSSHLRGNWWNSRYLPLPPMDRHVMHTGDPVQGYRQLMTPIDVAVMEDFGWEVDYSAIPAYP
jgi:hypothetical protein